MAPTKGQIIGELENLKKHVIHLLHEHEPDRVFLAVKGRIESIEDMVNNLGGS